MSKLTEVLCAAFDTFATLKHLAKWPSSSSSSGGGVSNNKQQFGRHGQSLMTKLPACRYVVS
jgi:hypothetical protein